MIKVVLFSTRTKRTPETESRPNVIFVLESRMEPVDYEEFVVAKKNDIDKESQGFMLTFPLDDVEKLEIPKKTSTVEMSKPELE